MNKNIRSKSGMKNLFWYETVLSLWRKRIDKIFNKGTLSETKTLLKRAHAQGFFKNVLIESLFAKNLSLVACFKSKVLLPKHPLKNVPKNKCTCNYMFIKTHTSSVYFKDKLSRPILETCLWTSLFLEKIRLAAPLLVQFH